MSYRYYRFSSELTDREYIMLSRVILCTDQEQQGDGRGFDLAQYLAAVALVKRHRLVLVIWGHVVLSFCWK